MFPNKVHVVSYENLLRQPKIEVSEILKFLGVNSDENIVRQIVEQNTFAKNEKSSGDNSFFRKGIDGDWVNYFSDENKELYKKIAGDELIKLSYEKDLNW